MKYGFSDICEITYYNDDLSYWGIIVFKDEEHMVVIDFNDFGEYNGYLIRGIKDIEGVYHSGKMLDFARKIVDFDDIPDIELYRKSDFIMEAIKNNRVLRIVKRCFPVGVFDDVKVLSFDGSFLTYRKYSRTGKLLSRECKVRINDIIRMQIDAKYQRLIERVRIEQNWSDKVSYSRTRISKITYFNDNHFDVGIVNDYSDDYISFVDFNIFGEYNGYILQSSETIEAVTHKGQYINFMESIIDMTKVPVMDLKNASDFINEAIKHDRVLGIMKYDEQSEGITDVKVLDFDGICVKYREYTRYAELNSRILKTKISNIFMLQIDSKYQKLIEKYREE